MFLSNGELIDGLVAGSLAETTPLYVGGNYYIKTGEQLAGQFAAYGALYRGQLWVYVVCHKIGVSAARVPLRVVEKTDTGVEPAFDTPYARLLADPNPNLDEYAFWNWTATTLEVYGEAIWVKLRAEDGHILALQPMHPVNTTVRRDDTGALFYWFTAGTRHTYILPPIPETDIVHFKNYNPDNTLRGMSALEPLRATLANEDAARRATVSFWNRGARPSIVLTHPGTLSEGAAKRLRANFEASHAGADRMGGTAVLEEGMVPQVVQLSAEEMQYIESRKLNREEVCGAYDVPPPVIHILDQATYSNITEQMRSMYRDTMTPRFRLFESTLEQQLRPEFDRSGTLTARFALDEVFRGDYETRVETAKSLVVNGVGTPNEARFLVDLPDKGPIGDKLYGNAALVPLGSTERAAPVPVQPGNPIPVPEAVRQSLTAARTKRARSLQGALSRAKDARTSRARLAGAHTDAFRAVFARQRASVVAAMTAKANGVFDPSEWDSALVDELTPVAEKTVETAGSATAAGLGGTFNAAAASDTLGRHLTRSAQRINLTTAGQIDQALEDDDPYTAVGDVFDIAESSRADQLGISTVTALWGLGSEEGASQAGGHTKTWVAGDNPRPEHAALDGETVNVGEPFSNGAYYPGDPDLDVDQTAGCNCDITYEGAGE